MIDRLQTRLRRLASSILQTKPVPQHVAFIMDGNRRFAEQHHLQRVHGHIYGYQRLIQALEWCFDLGVKCVSVYAFSLDNYNRSQQEVETLMTLAEEKLRHMLREFDVLERNGIQVRVIGDLSPAPSSVVDAANEIMAATKHHSNGVLNICFSYTSSREIIEALDSLKRSNSTKNTSSNTSLENFLYTANCPPVDLLIRTSGETRLSDFLMWQSRHALLVFTQVLWPNFGFLDLASAIIQYQRHQPTLDRLKHACCEANSSMNKKNDDGIALNSTREGGSPVGRADSGVLDEQLKAACRAAAANHHSDEQCEIPPSPTAALLTPLKLPMKGDDGGRISPCGVTTPPSGGSSSPSASSDNQSIENLTLLESHGATPLVRRKRSLLAAG